MGENYFGQLGTHNINNFEHTFTKVPPIPHETIQSVGCGFQHSLFVVDEGVYGCGKASDYQIQAARLKATELVERHETPLAMLKGYKVLKAAGGHKFSLIWVEPNKLFAVGQNRFGQCGFNYTLHL